MDEKLSILERTTKKYTPWLFAGVPDTAHASLSRRRPSRKGAEIALGAALQLIPLIPENRFISLFERPLGSSTVEVREFCTALLRMTRRLLGSPVNKRAFTRLIKELAVQQFEVKEKRRRFAAKHGFRPPGLVVISPSMSCNLKCYGCYAGEYEKRDGLPKETIDKAIKELREMGVNFITVSGGEPFFNKDVVRIWEENPDFFFLVYTNGTLIDDNMARKLAEMGNVYPAISVEGFEEATDQRRGKGTYARIIAAMDSLRKARVLFGFSATATSSNNEFITSDGFIDYYIGKGCLFGWYFNYIPIGRAPDMGLMPTPEQRIQRWRRIRTIRQNKPIVVADFWCDGSLTRGCLAGGRQYLHINNSGDVEPCVFTHFAADNIKEKTLTEILHSPLMLAIRSRQPYTQNHLRPCMIIDHPEILRAVVEEGGARPTHAGAETLIQDLAPDLDEYAQSYAFYAEAAWEELYGSGHRQLENVVLSRTA